MAAAPAHADPCPPATAIFLIDQSNSMNEDGSTVGVKKWQGALQKAEQDLSALTDGTQVAFVGFGNAEYFSGDYYHPVVALTDVKYKNAQTLATLKTSLATAATPALYDTPLAGAACDAIQEVWSYRADECIFSTKRQVYIYSDGLENSTPDGSYPGVPKHQCAGPRSTSQFNEALFDQGFNLSPDSWEWHMANVAWTGIFDQDHFDPSVPPPPVEFRPVVSVAVLFDSMGHLASRSGVRDGGPALSPDLQENVDANGIALFKGLAHATFGSYFEAIQTSAGVPAKVPVPGDTDPSPTRSCVDSADVNRVLSALNRKVRNNDPNFSGTDLAMRDVNNDLIINILDYQLVSRNYGHCS